MIEQENTNNDDIQEERASNQICQSLRVIPNQNGKDKDDRTSTAEMNTNQTAQNDVAKIDQDTKDMNTNNNNQDDPEETISNEKT